MRYIKMWSWIPLVLVLLFLVFVQVDRAETRVDPLDQRIVPQAGSPTPSEEMLERSSLHMVGQVGGRTEDVAVQGDYAYVAVGLRLVVLDVSQPSTPTQIGSTTPFPQFVAGVTVSGTLACVADGMAGLRIVDVSNPSAPIEIGVYDTPGYAEHVALAGQYAYVADGHYGLRIVDVSDPAHPVEVAYAYPLNYVFDVAVDGQYAYLAAAGAGLLVVDVSEPTHPVELGSLDTQGYAYGVDAAGDVVYVADGWEGLRVVSVADPAQPVEVGSYDTPGWVFGVDVVGSRAYVADAFGGLRVLDVSDPMHPVELGGYEVVRGHAGRVAVVGNTAYVADLYWGLRVVDVSDPGAPAQIGFYGPLGYAKAVAVSGDYAYVAAARQGLRVVDISDPAHPVEVGAYDTQGDAIGVAVVGSYAYVAASFREPGVGLHVVDVSDPAHPTGVGYCEPIEPIGMPQDIVVAGGMAYIANERGFELIDVSSPYTPTLAGSISFMGEEYEPGLCTKAVDVSGTLAYVAGGGGLYIVDVSNPVSPTLMSHLDDESFFYDVAVAADQAYINDGDCLRVIDVSDPLSPTQLSRYCGPYLPERVTVVSATAYVAFGSGGLYAIDVTDPLSPAPVSSYNTPGYAMASAVTGNTIYVADGQGGLVVLETGEAQSETVGPMCREPLFAENVQSGGLPDWPPMSRSGGSASPIYRNKHRPDPVHRRLPQPQPDVQLTAAARRILNTCVVTSTADSGPGTLRECMENAVSGDTILFDPVVFPPTSPVTIAPTSGLPVLSQGSITLDASNAGVILDGTLQDGSLVSISSDKNIIMGLQILNCPWAGVHIWDGAKHNVIGGNRTRGDGPTGEGNVISGNGTVGVYIGGTGTMHNIVIGNLIGTDVSGTSVLGNGWGVAIENGASYNRIGGLIPGERNIISGNRNGGVCMNAYIGETMGNTIVGNFIGTDVSGTVDLGNSIVGVGIDLGASNNLVKDNLISGNNWLNVVISDVGSCYNTVVGNLIGTDASGTQALGNRRSIAVFNGASFNRIGGTSPGDGNVINAGRLSLWGSHHSFVLGNLIGINISSTEAISNSQGHGIGIGRDSSHNFVGGTTDAERNVISGNGSEGIWVDGAGLNFIIGNYIGTDVSGMTALPNKKNGINGRGAKHTVIQGNLIAGNEEIGISIGNRSDFSHVRANYIGVAADGASPLPNGKAGVSISAASNTVGGTYPEDGNIIAFNGGVGVQVYNYSGNTIRRNSIYGNSHAGIYLGDGGNNLLAAPVITDALPGSVSGTACPGCIVEIFSDEEDEGQVYEGSVTADGQGNWTWIGSPSGPYVTATATDGTGNTSPFSTPKRK